MTNQEALGYVREHLTDLYQDLDDFDDKKHNVILALEEHVVPLLERQVRIEERFREIFEMHPHAFDCVNVATAEEIKSMMNKKEE